MIQTSSEIDTSKYRGERTVLLLTLSLAGEHLAPADSWSPETEKTLTLLQDGVTHVELNPE